MPIEVIRECLELALQEPTGFNRQNWRWLVVTDFDTRQAIGTIYPQLRIRNACAIAGLR